MALYDNNQHRSILTSRERQIFQLLVEDNSTKEISTLVND